MDPAANGAGQAVRRKQTIPVALGPGGSDPPAPVSGGRAQAERNPLITPQGATLDIIIPVYNEPENFPRLLGQLERWVRQPYRVLVIYDFEQDTTLPAARELARTRPYLHLLRNQVGPGVIGALKTGVAEAGAGPVLVVMADLSDDLSIVPQMLEMYRSGCQIVCPSRYMPGGRQIGGLPLKRLLSRLAGCSLFWIRGFPTHDATNNFRLYSGALLKRLTIESTGGFEFALEVTVKAHRAGCRIAELPTCWRDRTAGTSRFRLLHWLPRYLRWYRMAMLGW